MGRHGFGEPPPRLSRAPVLPRKMIPTVPIRQATRPGRPLAAGPFSRYDNVPIVPFTTPIPFTTLSPKIFRSDGFEVVLYTRDHPPPHVHVFNAEGECIVNLGSFAQAPSLRLVRGMRDPDVVRAFRIVEANQTRFLFRWREIHGT